MSYEVACGECGKTILIEEVGVEVHCPHCDTTIVLTEEDLRMVEAELTAAEAESAPPDDSTKEAETATSADETIADVGAVNQSFGSAAEPNPGADDTESPDFNFTGESAGLEETVELSGFSIKTGDSAIGVAEKSKSAPKKAEIVEKEPRTYSRRKTDVSATVFKSLISYSILATVVILYLLYRLQAGSPHQLESLPDIPQPEGNQFSIYRENASLAPGHTLHLGETQRFGNVEITPLKVTREPIRFQHFQTKRTNILPPTAPVLKLWLQVKNVSDNEVFPPFDKEMVNFRRPDKDDLYRIRANNWICKASDLSTLDHRVLMYDHPPMSEFDIAGMVFPQLKPGESVETFLPSQEEDLDRLQGDLVWRFQMRKGFNPETMHGVTTLIEVLFNSSDVVAGGNAI